MLRYIARVSDRTGRAIWESAQSHASREDAAAEAFAACPRAKTCSTSQVREGYPLLGGMNVQWHDKAPVWRRLGALS